jgi:starch-binding outer membrane protein, SusD/RagB family
MKSILKYLIVMLAFVAFSCSDDFLESESTEFISADRLSEVGPYNPEAFNGLVRGIYAMMYQTGTGGTDLNHDDFGQKGYEIYSDMLSGDMVLAGYNYGWYSDIAKMASTLDYTSLSNYKPWRYYYRIILAANSVIDGLGGNEVVPETSEEKYQMGQAKAMRAHSYFYLANLFVDEYDLNAEMLPIYISPDQTSQPLSTGKDVYALIQSDLKSSIKMLEGFVRSGLQEIDPDVAKGILAYVYLTMGEYDLAIEMADEVIGAGYQIVPSALVVGGAAIPRNAYSYIDGQGADWIWGFDITLDQGLDLVSWWGQVDYYTYSYAAAGDPKTMDFGLYSSIPDFDLRKQQFVNSNGTVYPLNKFYHEERKPMNQREITSDYVYMRVEEMYLIKAEAQAFRGFESDAQKTLKLLLENRIVDSEDATAEENLSYIDALSGDDLKEEIRKQWRIEMWGEGKSYLALKRFKANVFRQGHIDFNEVEIPYNDNRLTLEIPYQEVQDNPNISQ